MALKLLLLLVLWPMPALAQDSICAGLRRLVEAAPDSFVAIPEGERLFSGARLERRELNKAPNWPFEASYNVILMEHGPNVPQAPAARHYGALSQEIPRCIPALRVQRETRLPQQHGMSWHMPGVEVEILLDRSPGAGVYARELSVMRLR